MKTSHYINSLLYLLASLLLGVLISAYLPLRLQASTSEQPEKTKKVETRLTHSWGASSWVNAN